MSHWLIKSEKKKPKTQANKKEGIFFIYLFIFEGGGGGGGADAEGMCLLEKKVCTRLFIIAAKKMYDVPQF